MTGLPIPTKYDGMPHISELNNVPSDLNTSRFEYVAGGFVKKGNRLYINMILKVKFQMNAYDVSQNYGIYDTGVSTSSLTFTAYGGNIHFFATSIGKWDSVNNIYKRFAQGIGLIARNDPPQSGTSFLGLGSPVAIDGTADDIRIWIKTEVDLA